MILSILHNYVLEIGSFTIAYLQVYRFAQIVEFIIRKDEIKILTITLQNKREHYRFVRLEVFQTYAVSLTFLYLKDSGVKRCLYKILLADCAKCLRSTLRRNM